MLGTPDTVETCIRGLLSDKPDELLHRSACSADAMAYARRWLRMVANELRAELAEVLESRRKQWLRQWQVSLQGAVRDSEASYITVHSSSHNDDEDDEDDEDTARPPPLLYSLLHSREHGVLFFVSGFQPGAVGGQCRAIAFDVASLRNGGSAQLASFTVMPRHACYEVVSALSVRRAPPPPPRLRQRPSSSL